MIENFKAIKEGDFIYKYHTNSLDEPIVTRFKVTKIRKHNLDYMNISLIDSTKRIKEMISVPLFYQYRDAYSYYFLSRDKLRDIIESEVKRYKEIVRFIDRTGAKAYYMKKGYQTNKALKTLLVL